MPEVIYAVLTKSIIGSPRKKDFCILGFKTVHNFRILEASPSVLGLITKLKGVCWTKYLLKTPLESITKKYLRLSPPRKGYGNLKRQGYLRPDQFSKLLRRYRFTSSP